MFITQSAISVNVNRPECDETASAYRSANFSAATQKSDNKLPGEVSRHAALLQTELANIAEVFTNTFRVICRSSVEANPRQVSPEGYS